MDTIDIPRWLRDSLEGRTVWDGREVFGEIRLRIVRQPGDPAFDDLDLAPMGA